MSCGRTSLSDASDFPCGSDIDDFWEGHDFQSCRRFSRFHARHGSKPCPVGKIFNPAFCSGIRPRVVIWPRLPRAHAPGIYMPPLRAGFLANACEVVHPGQDTRDCGSTSAACQSSDVQRDRPAGPRAIHNPGRRRAKSPSRPHPPPAETLHRDRRPPSPCTPWRLRETPRPTTQD